MKINYGTTTFNFRKMVILSHRFKKEFLDFEASEKSGPIRKIVAPGKKDHYLSKKDSSTRLSDDQDFTFKQSKPVRSYK